MLVPLAMGFDLAQGWSAILKREVEAFGGMFETRDPNWSTEAGAQALTEAISSEPHPDVLVVMSPDLNSYCQDPEKGAGGRDLRDPDRQPRQFPRRCLCRQRLEPARPAGGRSRDQGLRRGLVRTRSVWCRAIRSTRPAFTSMKAS